MRKRQEQNQGGQPRSYLRTLSSRYSSAKSSHLPHRHMVNFVGSFHKLVIYFKETKMSLLLQIFAEVKEKNVTLFAWCSLILWEPRRTSKFQLPMSNWTRFFRRHVWWFYRRTVRINESDMYLYPDLDIWTVFPWGDGKWKRRAMDLVMSIRQKENHLQGTHVATWNVPSSYGRTWIQIQSWSRIREFFSSLDENGWSGAWTN